jgi:hypothetical protein
MLRENGPEPIKLLFPDLVENFVRISILCIYLDFGYSCLLEPIEGIEGSPPGKQCSP